MNDDYKKLLKNETYILKTVNEILTEAGWRLKKVDDGGDESEFVSSIEEAIDMIQAVDCSCKIAYWKNAQKRLIYVLSGNGNEGKDLIYDYSADGEFEELMDKACQVVELYFEKEDS